jgi:hypothetical protein
VGVERESFGHGQLATQPRLPGVWLLWPISFIPKEMTDARPSACSLARGAHARPCAPGEATASAGARSLSLSLSLSVRLSLCLCKCVCVALALALALVLAPALARSERALSLISSHIEAHMAHISSCPFQPVLAFTVDENAYG